MRQSSQIPQFTNRFGDVVELKLNGTSQVTVSVTVEAPADGSSRSYYVTETDKNGNVITGGESFGYQIGIEGSMVTVSESAPTGSVTITNKQVASGNQGDGSNGGGSTGGGSSSGSGSSSSQTVTSAQTGDNHQSSASDSSGCHCGSSTDSMPCCLQKKKKLKLMK